MKLLQRINIGESSAVFRYFSLIILFSFLYVGTSAQIVWLEKDYDFGLMKEAAGPAKGSVRFINQGKEEISVTGAKPSCGCTSVELPQDPIAPGDTAVIAFFYDPTGLPGRFDKSIRVYIGEHDSYRIGIKGKVLGTPGSLEQFYPYTIGNLRLSDIKIVGGEMTHGTSRNFFVTAYNQGQDSIMPTYRSESRALKPESSLVMMGPGDLSSVSLFFNSGLVENVGEVEIPVTVSYNSGDETISDVLTFVAKVTPDFSRLTPEQVDNGPRCYLYPPKVDLGIVSGSKSLEFDFGIQNQGKTKMNVLRISPREKVLSVKKKPGVIKPGKSENARLTINPATLSEGPFNIIIDVITDDPLHPVRTLSVVGIKE